MIFPNSNLPTASQSWGREITKQLSNIIDEATTNEINNAARDAQMNSSIIAIGAAATTANNSINGLIGLGSTGSSYTLHADNIIGGTITGVVFQTAASGTRVVTTSSSLAFFFGANLVGYITGDNSWSGVDSLAVRNAAGTHGFYTDATTATLHTPTGYMAVGNSGATLSSSGTIYVSGDSVNVTGSLVGGAGVSITSAVADGATSTKAYATNMSGDVYFNNYLYYPRGGTLATATGTGLVLDVNNLVRRTSSSLRYKTDVAPISLDYDRWVNMPMSTYRYKQDVEDLGDSAPLINGYIAEHLDQGGYNDLVIYQKDESGDIIPEAVNINSLAAGTHAAVKIQAQLIKQLSDRIDTLEAK